MASININETSNWEQIIRDQVTTEYATVDTAFLELYIDILKKLSQMSDQWAKCIVEVFDYSIVYVRVTMMNAPMRKCISTGHHHRYDFNFNKSIIETDDKEGWYDSWFELSHDYAWEYIKKEVEYSKWYCKEYSVV